ncbi:MAG: hypothetical protein AAF629_03780 [Chloroflexota bacterium]
MTPQKMPSLLIRIIVGFLANFITIAVMAAIFGEFVQSTYFPDLAAENPNMVFLFGGVFLMSLLIVLLYPYFLIEVGSGWFVNALQFAVLFGLTVYFATHMVQAGYIVVSPVGWLLEGLYDSLAPSVSIIVLAWLTRRQNKIQAT